MSLNPLKELKRRLDDDKTPLPKRLCLAKNVVQSHHFPTAPKERIVAEWLHALTEKNRLSNTELINVLDWLSAVDDLTSELKSKLIQIVAQYIQRNPLHIKDSLYISLFLEDSKISSQLSQQIDDYLTITITLLQYLRNDETNAPASQRILNNFVRYYKDSKKKLEFIIKLLQGENLETIFGYLDTECRKDAVDVCQSILFPINKKSYFISFLQTLIRKDNIEELISEKGDNIQSVIKIMNTFFEFPKNRSDNDTKFLQNFIDVFVSSFQKENQIVFAFYIMVASVLGMEQKFIIPAMSLPPILDGDAKIKRSLFLNMLEVLVKNEIDINVRLTDTFGEKISKVEIKKNFTSFLQAVMMGQLKLEGKLDKITLKIIKTALKLDPVLIENQINTILPSIMTAKKSAHTMEVYTETMNCLLEILFKLSRGTQFFNQILPSVKNILEASNTEQFELRQSAKEAKASGLDYEKIKSKIITGADLLPQECVNLYGKLTSDLMFRQNKELLELLQKDLEVYCLMMLEEGFVSPSIIVLTEVLSAILSSFLQFNKMADHTVPMNVAEEFWNLYKKFEEECLHKFGMCVLKLSYNPPLAISFLKLCQSYAQLKLLNMKYSNVKLDIPENTDTSELFDLSVLLPCLNSKQWIALAEKIENDEAVLLLDNLLLAKTMALQLQSTRNKLDHSATITPTKTHLIKQISTNPALLQQQYFCKILFTDLDKSHTNQLAKCLVKLCLNDPNENVLQLEAITNNKDLIKALVLETSKTAAKCFVNDDSLSKLLGKSDFNISSFLKERDIMDYFTQITLKCNTQDTLKNCVNIFKQLPIYYIEEIYQLVAIFVMLVIKNCSTAKKLKRSIDHVLQSIFELSFQRPDLYQIFPADNIFNFKDTTLLDLLTLKIKTPNTLIIIKSLLELAVKKVRIDSDQVRNIVKKLVKKTKNISDIESFNIPVFQITCLILPSIVKHKKALTASAFRSILADLQDQLNVALLESFKNIDFTTITFTPDETVNTEDSVVESNDNAATLNALVAYSLILTRYCEAIESEELQKYECVLSGLEFFVQNAIKTIENDDSKPLDIESSVQLLTLILRYYRKLSTHPIFQDNDKLFLQIWQAIKSRIFLEENNKVLSSNCLEEIGTLLRFACELCPVGCFVIKIADDLTHLVALKKPGQKDYTEEITSRKVFKYLWAHIIKAYIEGPKCVAMSKLMYRTCKNLRNWMRQHCEDNVARRSVEITTEDEVVRVVTVDDAICEIIRLDLDSLSEMLLAARVISLDYQSVDVTFEVQHIIHSILGSRHQVRCDITWDSFFKLFEGCVMVLNNLLMAREEVLEDRWPCYMQCYRALISSLCERSSTHAHIDRKIEEKLAEIAHSIEKLTQSISKRKRQVSRIAAYTVADLCTALERNAPTKMVRQHLENSVAFLLQACDSTYAMAFLKRGLVGYVGQMTMSNLYVMYKRYHKYMGNS